MHFISLLETEVQTYNNNNMKNLRIFNDSLCMFMHNIKNNKIIIKSRGQINNNKELISMKWLGIK